MGKWLSWVKSNEETILAILENLATKSVEVSDELINMLSDIENPKEHHAKIKKIEREADNYTREIFFELNKTFITPLDREDVQRIASKIDDVIDFIEGVSGRIVSYSIPEAPPYMLDISKELHKATKEVQSMMHKLNSKKGKGDLINHCRTTSDIEHTIDDLYRIAVGKLFETNDPINIIKLKDIYEAIESASDRCVDVADVVEDIVLKYA